jgi:hypothetical protein
MHASAVKHRKAARRMSVDADRVPFPTHRPVAKCQALGIAQSLFSGAYATARVDAATCGTVSWSHVGYPINETKSRAQCRRSAQQLRQSRKKKCPTSLRRRNRYVHRANTLPRPLSSYDTPLTPQTASTSPIRLRISSRSSRPVPPSKLTS